MILLWYDIIGSHDISRSAGIEYSSYVSLFLTTQYLNRHFCSVLHRVYDGNTYPFTTSRGNSFPSVQYHTIEGQRKSLLCRQKKRIINHRSGSFKISNCFFLTLMCQQKNVN